MADIRCPNCGKNNPDFLDVCQFCQTPLKSESMLHIGEKPTKKNTGELETVLPEWLRDVRQQARDSAEEEAAQEAARPKVQKDEAPDLLAGLASQANKADEEDVPDWLASINPAAKPKPETPSTPAPETDFFAQFNKSESKPAPASEPAQEDVRSRMGSKADQSPPSAEKDELSEWFAQAAEQPEETVAFDPDAQQSAAGWGSNLDSRLPSAQEPAPKEEEDLSWLHNLEAAAKQTGDLQSPQPDRDWSANFDMPSASAQPSAAPDDLSWLDSLGGIAQPAQPSQASPSFAPDASIDQTQDKLPPEQPSPHEDLGWLKNLGATPEPQPFDAAPDKPISSQPVASQEDLSWLNNLGGETEPLSAAPFAESESSSQDDLSWLKNMQGQSQPPPFSTEEFSPRQTAPLGGESKKESEPDWLKSATQAPSMPAPGDLSMDWFRDTNQRADDKPFPSAPQPSPALAPGASVDPAPVESDLFSTPGGPSTLSNQDVDSLFSVEMPDWLSRPEVGAGESASQQAGASSAENDESLAPVDLPSWVQAMRPVEAAISETTPSLEDQPTEKEGPLAGLRGVIPAAPIGSSRRPKALSLKLQATDEQQASAVILEQILGSETSPRALITSSIIVTQQVLRWALTGLFLIVLSAVIFLRSQRMPISASLPVEVSGISNVLTNIPDNARVLVVIDYEPSLAGEMEAVGGPLLDQLVLLRHPELSFISTSTTGSALIERLMTSTRINAPAPDGFGYQAGVQYFNLGYLPGGSAGVLGFIEAPSQIIPSADVQSFSEYSALIVLSDHAESGRIWVEQLQNRKQIDPALASQPLLMVASAQAGPLLQPYVSSRQISGMISGLSDAARYEFVNNSRPGIARSYWDAFGVGLMMSIALIVIGSLWSLFTGIRARRAEAEQG